jgi:hypothetical protein
VRVGRSCSDWLVEKDGSLARMPNHAMRLHEWGTRQGISVAKIFIIKGLSAKYLLSFGGLDMRFLGRKWQKKIAQEKLRY